MTRFEIMVQWLMMVGIIALLAYALARTAGFVPGLIP